MPQLIVSMGDPNSLTTGLPREEVAKITWEQFIGDKVGGGKRAMIIADMLKYRLPAQVRLNDDRLGREDTAVTTFSATYGYDTFLLTDEWQDVPADFAYQLYTDAKEQTRYGAATYGVEWQEVIDENGQSVRVKVAVPIEGVQMFDFRFKHEGGLVIATR